MTSRKEGLEARHLMTAGHKCVTGKRGVGVHVCGILLMVP